MVYSVTPPYCLYIALVASEYWILSVRIPMALELSGAIYQNRIRAVTIDRQTRNRNLAWPV